MDRLTRCFLEIRDELLKYLTRRAGRTAAEDVAQDVWVKLRERGDPSSWREPRAVLFKTAAHLATDRFRHDVRTQRLFGATAATDQEPVTETLDPQHQVEAQDQLERLVAALEQLPELCREAFLMNRIDGLTHVEIAARLGISTKSVQRYIERALRHCLREIEE